MIVKSPLILIGFLVLGLVGRGQEWVKIGKADDGSPTDALFADTVDNVLYVGGSFNRFTKSPTDSVTASSIATWNGTQWDTLGEGTNCLGVQCPRVFDIVRYQDKIYACGEFSKMGNVNSSIAAWNGSNWEFVADSPNSYISSLVVINNTLYITGGFTEFEGISVNGLVKYDGTTFSDVHGFGLLTFSQFSSVSDIEKYNDDLYVSGRFEGEAGKTHICRFDGAQWVDVGGGVTPDENYLVIDLITYKNELYACGKFEQINGENYGNSIARWDGSQWKNVGGGMAQVSTIYGMSVWRDNLVVLGVPAALSSIGTISMWNGTEWCSPHAAEPDQWITASTSTLSSYQDTLYIGGGFTYFDDDDLPVSIIAKYTGDVSDWDTCGTYALGMDEVTGANGHSISVFPNPTSEYVTVQVSKGVIHTLTVFDVYGKIVAAIEPNDRTVELNMRQWPTGIYLIVAQSEHVSVNTRLVKQ